MKKDNYLPFNALKKGYILVPKHLLNYKFSQKDESFFLPGGFPHDGGQRKFRG